MRLHSLSICAFGPFAGTEVVDFDSLNSAGIFLLHGPTGAGKTSILDALCFAIYGVVPGVRGQAARLRSDHADPEQPTEVRLELTVRGRRLRFVRSPGWERPKRRGTGTTKEQPRVLVQELLCDGEERTISTRLDEAGHFVRDIIGMTPDQFCQVVLLPQGRFADFLRADAEARRALLEQLFATQRFSAVEAYLVEQRRARRRDLEGARIGLTALLARIAQAARVDPATAPISGEDDLDIAGGWAAGLLQQALTASDEAGAAEASCSAALAQARAAHQAAVALQVLQQRHAEATDSAAGLAADREEVQQLHARLAAARSAAALQPVLRDELRARDHAASCAAEAGSARATLPAELQQAGTAELREHHLRMTGELAVLAELADDDHRVSTLTAERERVQAQATAAIAVGAAVQAELAQLPEQIRQADAAARDAELAGVALESLPQECDAAQHRAAAAVRRDDLLARHSATADELRAATDTAQSHRAHWLDLRQARLDGMAAELAGRLADGEPCSVCGSTAHPAPAEFGRTPATADDERAAHAVSTAADTAQTRLQHRVSELAAALAAAEAVAGGATAVATAEAAAQLTAQLRTAQALAEALAERQQACARLRAHDDALRERVRSHELEAADAGARAATLDVELAEVRRRVDASRGEDASIAARRQRLGHLADTVAEAVTKGEAAAAAGAGHKQTRASARDAALASGFTGVDEARAAACSVEEESAWRARASALEGLQQAVTAVLSDVAVQAAAQQSPAEVDATAARLADAEELATTATLTRGAVTDIVLALEQLTLELTSTLNDLKPLVERHRIVEQVSRLAEGSGPDNALRMRLSAFVLAARLEQVALAANARLSDMSGGRYTLAYTDGHAGGRGKAGLGLRVIDAWTGHEREPGTLSGGETFAASLALALGLADVATAEAGGILLDTLLVDEGFGGLDDESLEEVMGVLDGLREGGRAVGLVSHVADLRARIPTQLRVVKGRSGSRIEQSVTATTASVAASVGAYADRRRDVA